MSLWDIVLVGFTFNPVLLADRLITFLYFKLLISIFSEPTKELAFLAVHTSISVKCEVFSFRFK